MTFDILSQVKLNEITYISRNGDKYYLGFEDVKQDTYNVADKVFTGNVGMNGKLGVSRVLKAIREVTKVSSTECKVEISEGEAKAYTNMIKAEGIEYQLSNNVSKLESEETGNPVSWVVYIIK